MLSTWLKRKVYLILAILLTLARTLYTHCSSNPAAAEAAHYRIKLEAEANALKLTPEYLRMILYQSLANNTKVQENHLWFQDSTC